MATWCLTKSEADILRKKIKDGSINPNELEKLKLSSQRREFFEKFISKDNAKQVNALFESKMLLKNKKRGYITWAKNIIGVKPSVRRDIIATVERLDTLLSPKDEEKFLNDLVDKRLGTEVTQEEAEKIFQLSEKVKKLQEKTDPTKSDITLGNAKLDLSEYVNSLKGTDINLFTNLANVPRALTASLDLSAPLNQGWGMISRKRFYTSLGSMFKAVVSKKAYRDLQASIITEPLYPSAMKAGLRISEIGDKLEKREEQFMTTLLDKVPLFNHSQRAYTSFLNKLRMDTFKDFVARAEVAGENVTEGSKVLVELANVVNNFTGGAKVGKVEGAVPALNAMFFSPRKIASTLQMMNPVNYFNPKISPTARKEAVRNLIGSVSLTTGIITLYALLTGNKQEADPRSSDFGKIRVGDTRLDLTGGNGTYVTLISRLATGQIKGTTGINRKLGTGYGETSGFDLLAQFARYKLSPNASLLVDAVTGANAIGEKKTITQSVLDRFKPMFASSVYELIKSDTDGKFVFALAGLMGAGLNTYSTDTNWEESTSVKVKQFKEKVGKEKFTKANEEFNTSYENWLNSVTKTDSYKNLSDEAKKSLVSDAKTRIQDKIFRKYNFSYKKDNSKQKTEENNTVKTLLPK